MADVKAIAEELVNLTVKEVNELVNVLKEEYGIEPAAAAVAVAAGPAAAAAEAVEEQTEFNVTLKSVDAAKKIACIKEVRAITGLGLKEAKELCENGGVLKEGVSKDEAKAMKEKLEAAGCVIEVK